MGRNLSGRKVLALFTLPILILASPGLAAENAPFETREDAAPRTTVLHADRPVREAPRCERSGLPETSGLTLEPRQGRSAPPVYALDIPEQPAIERRLQHYLEKEKRSLQLVLERAPQFRRHIAAVLRERGLPPELLFLPVLESRYSVRAVSRTGAAGLWQIARNTSGALSLAADDWLDERRDFWKSTEAAARKLQDNYRSFGDWSLALAAYNCGSGALSRLIAGSGVRDFWELRERGLLSRETAEFVPSFFALVRIFSAPERYGLKGSWDPSPEWERVLLRESVDLRLLAQALNLSWDALRQANAELRYSITPHYKQGYWLKVPVGQGARVTELLADPQTELLRYRFHRLASGDTLYALARSYGVALALIEQANPELEARRLRIGSIVRIPAVEGSAASPPDKLTASAPSGLAASPAPEFGGSYTIQRGDTLWSIARSHGTTAELLAAANSRALDDILKPGETLRVPLAGGIAR